MIPSETARAAPAIAGSDPQNIDSLAALDIKTHNENPSQTQPEKRNPGAVREAKLELIREAIFENLGGARLFIETAQLLIEARDDTGMTHAVRMGAHHYRAVVLLAKDIAALKAEGQQ